MRSPSTPLHLLHVFPTFVPAGSQQRTARIANAAGGRLRHTFLALDNDLSARELLDPALEARFLRAAAKSGSASTALRLTSLIAREQPDLLCTYNFGALDGALATLLLGRVPHVHHEDGFSPDEAQGLLLRRTLMRRVALSRAGRVVVISRRLERIALDTWQLDPERVQFLPNGIDVERFVPAPRDEALRQELGIPRDAFVVGSVGHLRPEKNFARLLRALAPLEGCVVLIVGDGAQRPALERLARQLGMAARLRLPGYAADPRPFYRAMDLFALSSDTEQAPLSLLEAMAHALPAVSTDVGDVADMLGEQASRCVVPLRDAGAPARARDEAAVERDLLRCVAELRAERGRAAHIGAALRRTVETRFDQRAMVERYLALYRVVAGHSAAPPSPA